MIQAKGDTFDGLDPLSMFAAEEATTNKTPAAASVPVLRKERVCAPFFFVISEREV